MARLYLILLPVLLLSCAKTTAPDPCNVVAGHFIRGRHYIASELLNEEGRLNYAAWVKLYHKNAKNIPEYNCIPIKEHQSMEEIIREQKENANLLR